jgi:hypothetical protein
MNFLYIDQNGDPTTVSKRQIKARFPNVSFPNSYPKERMAEFNVFVWEPDPRPAFDAETQRLVAGGFRLEGDEYRRAWVVEDIPAAEREAAAQAEADSAVQGDDLMVELAKAMVDLVLTVDDRNRNSQAAPNTAQARQALRDRVLFYARQKRGL